MALPAVYFLLLLCSMAPLFHASVCPRDDEYCPAGEDCKSNSSFCKPPVCNINQTSTESCDPKGEENSDGTCIATYSCIQI